MSGYQNIPVNWPDAKDLLRKIATAVNGILDGKINATGVVTLTASGTSTVVSERRCGTGSVILLMPTTSNAAGALATTYIGTVTKQSFTITHANTATVDRTFKYVILG